MDLSTPPPAFLAFLLDHLFFLFYTLSIQKKSYQPGDGVRDFLQVHQA